MNQEKHHFGCDGCALHCRLEVSYDKWPEGCVLNLRDDAWQRID